MGFPPVTTTDFLVIGCGVAGLRAAVELGAAGRVLVLAKDRLSESASEYAQGGVAVALSDEDEVGLHRDDTLRAGDELCDEKAVEVLVGEGPQYIQELIEWGTQFDRAGSKLSFAREGAHSRWRVLHAGGDSTGREITRTLFARAAAFGERISFHSFASTVDLIAEAGRVCGAVVYDEQDGRLKSILARAVLLATGGLGHVYSDTTNPDVATGDGIAIAYRAGAALSDMEFVQFHPTALYLKGAPRFLLSEALRGEGAVLRNGELKRFMARYHPQGELAPRDVVSRAIVCEMQRTRSEFVYLDLTHLDGAYLRKRFPRIYATCLEYNIDLATDIVPVRPAAHYAMGGVATGLDGRTSLAGLYAAGECACTGVHGANRLASNSLLEGLVFGARAGLAMLAEPSAASGACPEPQMPRHAAEPEPCARELRQMMWRYAGIIRCGKDLTRLADRLVKCSAEPQRDVAPARETGALQGRAAMRQAFEYRNMLVVGELIARSALARLESRGAHYRSDFPYKVDRFREHSYAGPGMKVTFR
jgi:L-aspartate oxidase